ncbi:hypothetical protein M4578_18660 [Salipiger sp. P9]|uniref:hypothetical protein n=1 Tax=Salipiger pentaromativorans TaxID=2943193 RepID=UPI002157EA26|nr:hypothetical protein [Salipiger pentaromativorans]MCR8549855.1 hypothetical protein [Salipiger pentaromativorans]
MPKRTAGLLAAVIATGLFATPALPQTQSRVEFEKGASGATISGTIKGNAYIDYLLGAGKGQTLEARVIVDGTNGNGTIYFNIMPPGATWEALFVGSRDGHEANVTLPESGDYTIRVYLMGNDKDAGKTVGFRLPVSIR